MSDTRELNIRFYVVAILDVLGQTEALQAWSERPSSPDKEPAFQEAVWSSVDRVIEVRKDLSNFLAQYSVGHHVPEVAVRASGVDLNAVRSFQHMSPGILQFSDMIVAFCPIVNIHEVLTVEPVVCFLITVGRTLLLNLSKGTPLRGAIDVGLATPLPETRDLYGPVLAQVHRLESKVADYPRIVLGPGLVRYVAGGATIPVRSYGSAVNRGLAEKCKELVTQDDDSHWIVDYLSEFSRNLDGSPGHWEPVRRNAYSFIQAERARFQAIGDDKKASRYARLIRYFETRGFQPKPRVVSAE